MKTNLLLWGTVIGAFRRIDHYRLALSQSKTYFERLRIVNEALGAHWVFRLADAVGLEKIRANRLSWYRFYVEDVDRLHCPLDPGAPETEAFLGKDFSEMDMGFYAGMGFDGYRLALQTPRVVDLEAKHLDFDGRYRLTPSTELKAKLDAYDTKRFIPKEDYYAAYGDALTVLYANLDRMMRPGAPEEDLLERTAAGCLILLCGGHSGCTKHLTDEERFRAQMESMIIFNHARNVITGIAALDAKEIPLMRVVS